jgi:hypothetical protein
MSLISQQYASTPFTDLAYFADKRYFGFTQSRYPYWVLTQDPTTLNQYGEIAESAGEPVLNSFTPVCMRVVLNPEKQLLKKWGQDNPRDALVEFSIAVLLDIGLMPKQGDRFEYNNEQYELEGGGREAFWGNSKIPLRLVFFADKHYRVPAV